MLLCSGMDCALYILYEQKTNNLKDISPLFFRSGQPIPIENLRGEHTLDSRVRLVISYQVTGAFLKNVQRTQFTK